MPPEFECIREVILRASPDEVWEAIATKAGNAAWLFPNEIDPSGAGATAWDPPHHFAVRQEQGDWFNALECVIEARDGATSLLRYAHSGIFVDDWDNQYDAVRQHTDFYLDTLSQSLEHFRDASPPPSATYPKASRDRPRQRRLTASSASGGLWGSTSRSAKAIQYDSTERTQTRTRESSTTCDPTFWASARPTRCTASSAATPSAARSG